MKKTPFILGLLLIAASTALAQLAVAGDPSAAGFVAERLDRIDVAINAEIADAKIPGAVDAEEVNGWLVERVRNRCLSI